MADTKAFIVRLNADDRATLEAYQAKHELRSLVAAIRHLIRKHAPKPPPKPSLRDWAPGELAAQVRAMLSARLAAGDDE